MRLVILGRWEGRTFHGDAGGELQHLGATALKDLLPMEHIVNKCNKLVPEDLRVRQTEQECGDESNQQEP